MPITDSAKKALRASKRKHVYNVRRDKAIDDVAKKLKKLVVAKDSKGALALLPQMYQALDKAAKTHTIDKNTASRKKSRFAAMVKRVK